MSISYWIKEPFLPLLRITGDRNEHLVSALLALSIEERAGLIEVIPIDGGMLSIQEVSRHRSSYVSGIDNISQLLQDNGYKEASKFIDCAYEL